LAQRSEQRQVAHVGKAQIQQDDVEWHVTRGDQPQCRDGVAGLLDVEPEAGESFGDRPPNQRLIVDDQHPARIFSRNWC
jgi:hypothetical protein